MKKCLIHDWKYYTYWSCDLGGEIDIYKCSKCNKKTYNPENSLNDVCHNIYNSLLLLNPNIHFLDIKNQVQKILKSY